MYIFYYTVYFCYLCIFSVINKAKQTSKDFLSTLYSAARKTWHFLNLLEKVNQVQFHANV